MQLLYSISCRLKGRYHLPGSKGGLHPLLAMIIRNTAAIASSTFSYDKNSPSALSNTLWTQPGRCSFILKIKAAVSLPLTDVFLQSFPIRYSRVSSINTVSAATPYCAGALYFAPCAPLAGFRRRFLPWCRYWLGSDKIWGHKADRSAHEECSLPWATISPG